MDISHFTGPYLVWPSTLQSLEDFLKSPIHAATTSLNKTKYNSGVADKKPSTNWFMTISAKDGLDPKVMQPILEKKCKTKTAKRVSYCWELTQDGKPHVHLIVEFKKPKALSEFKRVFNIEKTMKPPKYLIKQFDNWDKICQYLAKDKPEDISFRNKNNLLDIYQYATV